MVLRRIGSDTGESPTSPPVFFTARSMCAYLTTAAPWWPSFLALAESPTTWTTAATNAGRRSFVPCHGRAAAD